MKNILIFKTDKLGDLLNISPIIFNLKKNYPNCHITLICSSYNYSIANFFSNDLSIIIYKKPFMSFLFKNFKILLNKKYDLILQLDGKNHSYLSSIFIRSNKKACLRFIKKKIFFGFNIFTYRPNNFLKMFFDITVNSIEDYDIIDNKNYHYLSLYLKIFDNLKIKVSDKSHYLPFNKRIKISKFSQPYFFLHIDERWNIFNNDAHRDLKLTILKISKDNKIVISSNIGGNILFDKLASDFKSNLNIEIVNAPNLHDIVSLIYDSHTCVSSHSGLIVHVAASFKKKIIDIVSADIFNELDRWIPYNVDYKRFDIKNFITRNFFF